MECIVKIETAKHADDVDTCPECFEDNLAIDKENGIVICDKCGFEYLLEDL